MAQHVQIGETRNWVNEHGAVIEQTFWKPSELDDKGRCCGRKPIRYKRDNYWFCPRCNRTYWPTGRQRENWAFKLDPSGYYERKQPIRLEN